MALLKDYILFAEKDEELQKFILRQHQTTAVERVVENARSGDLVLTLGAGNVWQAGDKMLERLREAAWMKPEATSRS